MRAEFTDLDLKEALALSRLGELYVHTSWCNWHEGVQIFDDSFPGNMRPIDTIRSECTAKQHRNSYAQNLIKNASNNELRAVLSQIEPRVEVEHYLSVHFRWVAYHEGQRALFLDALDKHNFSMIRSTYESKQDRNSNARHLLSCVSNAYIKNIVDAL